MTSVSVGSPRFLTVGEVLTLHKASVSEYGGLDGIRDQGLLSSAIAQAQQGFSGEYSHQFPFGMAAAYAFHIAKNHAFLDGNKRTAWTACGVFLRLNGWSLVASEAEATEFMLGVTAGTDWTKDRRSQWLQAHSKPRPSLELRDFFAALSPELHLSHITAYLATPDHAGKLATINEASRAIPLIRHLTNRAEALAAAGDQEAAQTFAAMFAVLVAVYRVAEDMGYEW